jgi:hypothetical protein
MVAGLSPFTLLHTALSLLQLLSGVIVVIALMGSRTDGSWTALYILSTLATVITGFMFPFATLLPSHIFGIITLVLVLLVILGRYSYHFDGSWRWIYAIGMVLTVYLDAVVTIVQAFLKVPPLHVLAPTGTEPPLIVAQGCLLVIFVVLAVAAIRRFHPRPADFT